MKKSGIVALAGRPNVGKSTLLNSILKEEISVVTPKAQTTRDQIRGILNDSREGQLVLVDVPGFHTARPKGLNDFMVQQAVSALEGIDAVWYLLEPTSEWDHEKELVGLLARQSKPVFPILNKIDWSENQPDVLAKLAELGPPFQEVSKISAKRKKGVESLLANTWHVLPGSPALYPNDDDLSDKSMRFVVSEKIREQLFRNLGDELPYSSAVKIDKYVEPGEGSRLTRIEGTIYVERESQKAMVIGKRGQKIKEIGTQARNSIEKLVDGKVFLGLNVGVLKNWTKNPEMLKKLGYENGVQ